MTNQPFSRVNVCHGVTLDVLGAIVVHRSEAVAAECEKATPNEVAIATAQKTEDKLRTIREDPDPSADEVIERVIAQCDQQARDLYQ